MDHIEPDGSCQCHGHGAEAANKNTEPERRTVLRKTWRQTVLAAAAMAIAAMAPGRARAGYGRCGTCNCPEYKGQLDMCGNCGHAFTAHY